MAREGKCPCLSQTDDSIVFCGKDDGHDGLHEWRDPVHPGHCKIWGGNVTDIVTSTQYRFVSPSDLISRCGVSSIDGTGRARYAPMQPVDGPATAGDFFTPGDS